MIVRARVVLTMEDAPIENGAIAIDGAFITGVGTFSEIKARNKGEVLDLGEQTLLPGLINAHCHLDYTILRGQIPRQPSFAEWIRQINSARADLSEEDYLGSIAAGFAEAQRFGTTTIINLEAFPELLARILPSPLRTWWCAELIDIRKRVEPADVVQAMRAAAEQRGHLVGGFGLAPHAPYTASAELYRQCFELRRRENLLLTTHLAESHEEMEMFRSGGGPLFEFMESFGRRMNDCGSKTPLALLLEETELNEDWLIAHLNELTSDDFDRLATAKKFHVVHCPRSHRYFGHTAFPLQKLHELGFNISLGTDSLASNSDLSLFAEMQALRQEQPALAPKQILEMVTVNPAKALRLPQTLGRIRAGCFADLIALSDTAGGDIFEQVVSYQKPPSWMMIAGRVLDRI